ncbi:MAG: ADP-ribosylglycohydrolase family protein [Trueperaceae bacterium]|nr:ADP-ribosylglycohydrolase family protein [Trueperaceae bacterium]
MTTTADRLEARFLGSVIGGAVGDALGGPVEGLDFTEIDARYGWVDDLLPYEKAPSEHAHFTNHPGSVTDDTRLHAILVGAILDADGDVVAGDLTRALVTYERDHGDTLSRSFVEEYVLKGLYRGRKLAFGGQPTNGAVMGNGAIGLLHAADPGAAFAVAYELAFVTDGYAKESAGIGAAAVSAAMSPGATPLGIVDAALSAADRFRRDGPLWRQTIVEHSWAKFEGRPNHVLIETAVAAARRNGDVRVLREALYPVLKVSPVGSEAGQSVAVALAMLVATDGDYRASVLGAVNYGRDNDSYATIVGALAGALHGIEAVPAAWRDTVVSANPDIDLEGLARRLATLVRKRHAQRAAVVEAVGGLIAS